MSLLPKMSDSAATSETGAKRSPPPEDASEDGPPEDKKQKVEPEAKPPPGQYKEIRKILRSLNTQASKSASDRDTTRINSLLGQLKRLCSETPDRELAPAAMVIQMHLKNAFFNSEGIKDGDNIKTFLSGVEDGSEGKSDKDDSVYVFYANHATALWYRWDEAAQHWCWTPEANFWLWMKCSTTEVSDGQWKGEIPAPENVEIIHYLDAVRPVPSDEVYISDLCNVASLLTKLATVAEAKEAVKEMATLLREQQVPTEDKAEHLKAFREGMNKLID